MQINEDREERQKDQRDKQVPEGPTLFVPPAESTENRRESKGKEVGSTNGAEFGPGRVNIGEQRGCQIEMGCKPNGERSSGSHGPSNYTASKPTTTSLMNFDPDAKKPPDPAGPPLMTAKDVESFLAMEDESQEMRSVPEGRPH